MAVGKTKRRSRVAVIGVGGVGGYYAGLLARAGNEVFALARGTTLAALQDRGLLVRTPDQEWTSQVTASDDAGELSGARRFPSLATRPRWRSYRSAGL